MISPSVQSSNQANTVNYKLERKQQGGGGGGRKVGGGQNHHILVPNLMNLHGPVENMQRRLYRSSSLNHPYYLPKLQAPLSDGIGHSAQREEKRGGAEGRSAGEGRGNHIHALRGKHAIYS
jgi:hypothetical protein